jgi:hypothetical protein
MPHSQTYPSPYIRTHLESPDGSLGFSPFSICSIMSSNDLVTFSLYRALASVKAHLNFSASSLPFSTVTWRCSGRRSLLLPTMVIGTHSVPYEAVRAARLPRGNCARPIGFSTYQMIQDLVLDDLNHLE